MRKAAILLKKKGGKGKGPKCPDLTAEEEEEIAAAINDMGDDDEVTVDDYLAMAEAEGLELSEKDMKEGKKVFDLIDTDNSGSHSKAEL